MKIFTSSVWAPGTWACFFPGVEHIEATPVSTASAVTPDDWLFCLQPNEPEPARLIAEIMPRFAKEHRVLLHYEGRYTRPLGYRLRYLAEWGHVFTSCTEQIDNDTVCYWPVAALLSPEDCLPYGSRAGFCATVHGHTGIRGGPREAILRALQQPRNHDVRVFGACGQAIPAPRWDFKAKVQTLSQFRFCLAMESACDLGHVTEKIFHAFAAGCVPIYVGAPDIGAVVPPAAFVDFRAFWDLDEALDFCRTMPSGHYAGMVAAAEPHRAKWIAMRDVVVLLRWAMARSGMPIAGDIAFRAELDALSATMAEFSAKFYGGMR